MRYYEERLLAAAIIKAYKAKSAVFSSTLSSTLGLDAAVLTSLGHRTIRVILVIYKVKYDPIAVTNFLQSFYVNSASSIISKSLLSWIPLIGAVANSAISYNLSAAMGWSAVDCIERYGKLEAIDSAEMRRGKVLSSEMEVLFQQEVSRLPEGEKKQVDEVSMTIIETKEDDSIDENISELRLLILGTQQNKK